MRGGPPPTSGDADGGANPFAGGMPGGFSFGGMPGGGGGGTRTFHFSTGPGGSSGFRFSNADDIFRNFAKASGGMGGMGGGGGMDEDDLFSMLGGGLGGGRGFRTNRGSTGFKQSARAPTPEPTVMEKELPLTLEEIMKGVTKKVTVKSKTFDPATGKRTVQDVTLEAKIKPGLRTGSKLKYRGVGDQEEGGKQDVHLIVTEVGFLSCPTDLGGDLLTVSAERTSQLQTPRRPPHHNGRIKSERGPHRLGTYCPHDRRQVHQGFQAGTHATGLRGTVSGPRYDRFEETERAG